MCGVYFQTYCITESIREIQATYSAAMEGKSLSSVSCYHFSLMEGVTPAVVRFERVEL